MISYDEDGNAFIKNLSASCFYLDNNLLEISQEKQLFGGERLSLEQDEETSDAKLDYVFCFVHHQSENLQKLLKIESDLQKELSCSICTHYLEKCMTLTPCQHSFCSFCLFHHIKWSSKCPLCRGEIAYVAKNPVLSNVVQLVTDSVSIPQRTPQERKELEHVNLSGVIVRSAEGAYIGLLKNGKKDGQGKFIYQDGKIYEGDWEKDYFHGTGTLKFQDGRIYKGTFKNSKIEGLGVMTFSNGDKYDGYWKNELKHGGGKYTWSCGQEYKGNFEKDFFDGHGVMKYADGKTYNGIWKKEKREGDGSLTFPNGDKYKGEWLNDVLQPEVKVEYSNGEKYQGEIEIDGFKKHGKGTLILQNDNKYTGNWVDDVLQSEFVKIEYSNGDRYEGEIEGDFFRKQGKGIIIYNSGDQYDGDWVCDRQQGHGKYCWKATKCSFEAHWEDGKMIGDGVMIFEDGTRLKAKWEKLEGESNEEEDLDENREMNQSQVEDKEERESKKEDMDENREMDQPQIENNDQRNE